MSQYIVDDELDPEKVTQVLQQWTTAQRLSTLRPGQVIKDERVPQLLAELKQPTFITIDDGFWNRTHCDDRYCILYFVLREDNQAEIPGLLRRLVKLEEFKTREARRGKVARISRAHIAYWQTGSDILYTLAWPPPRRRQT
jgi:hypothetical protein